METAGVCGRGRGRGDAVVKTLPQLLRAALRFDIDLTFRSPRFHGPKAARWNVKVFDWSKPNGLIIHTQQPTLLKALRETVGRMGRK